VAEAAEHQLPRRELPLAQGDRQVDIVLGEQVTFREIAPGVDAADVRIQVLDLLLQRRLAVLGRCAAHLLRLAMGLKPQIDLVWKRGIRSDLRALGADIDVPLEEPDALAVSDQQGRMPVVVLVTREPDRVPGIAVHQEVDLMQLELVVLGRIGGDAVVERQGNAPSFEEDDQVI
jgi:hypothetical protein